MDKHLNITALGLKFQNFEVSSSMASFEAFENRVNEKKKRTLWLELSLLLLAIILTLVLLGYGTLFDKTGKASSSSVEHSQTASGITSEMPGPNHANNLNSGEVPASVNDIAREKASGFLHPASNSSPDLVTSAGIEPVNEKTNASDNSNPDESKAVAGGQSTVEGGMGETNLAHMHPRLSQMKQQVKEQQMASIEKKHADVLNKNSFNPGIKPFLDIRLECSFGVNLSDYGIKTADDADTYVHKNYGDWTQSSMQRAILPFANLNISYPLSRDLSIRTGLNFRQSGASMNYDISINHVPVYGFDGKITGYIEDSSASFKTRSVQKITYWSIPIGMDYSFRLRNLYGFAGFQIDMANRKGLSGYVLNPGNIKSVVSLDSLNFRRFNIGGTLRFGLGIPLNETTRLGFVMSYHRGFSGNLSSGAYNYTNRGIGIGVHLSFELPRQWK